MNNYKHMISTRDFSVLTNLPRNSKENVPLVVLVKQKMLIKLFLIVTNNHYVIHLKTVMNYLVMKKMKMKLQQPNSRYFFSK